MLETSEKEVGQKSLVLTPQDQRHIEEMSNSEGSIPAPVLPTASMIEKTPILAALLVRPTDLEHARQLVSNVRAYIAYLTAFIEREEAAQREPRQSLEERLSELVQDLEPVDVSPAEDENPETPEDVHSTSNRGHSYSQNASFTLKQSHVQVPCTSTDMADSYETRVKFKADIVKVVQSMLEPYRKKLFKCPKEFKRVTRKLTHSILEVEEKNQTILVVTDGVRNNAKKYVRCYIEHLEKESWKSR
uniref:SRI domain-containing protein n=1 Tax=Steinernema glaseri TaxID=37863 RepID=A0A1I7YTQ0_9BILA